MTAAHRIRRQRWQVRAPSPAAAFAVRQTLREVQETSLLPALESAFDSIADDGIERHIRRLEITVRVSSPERLAEELPARLGDAALLALADLIEAAPADANLDLAIAERLRHYLRHGQVAWFDADRAADDLHARLADEAARWSRAPDIAWRELQTCLSGHGTAQLDVLFRFLQLLGADGRATWWAFARQSSKHDSAALTLVETLYGLQAGTTPDAALHLLALALLRPGLNDAQADSDWATAVARCAERVPAVTNLSGLSTVNRKNGPKMKMPFAADSDAPEHTSTDDARAAHDNAPPPPTNLQISPDFPVDRGIQPGQPLRSAGLVLLHPYLPRLFAALGWLAERHPAGMPFPREHLPRALALLHWLATGGDEPYEYELGTAKLLLGIAPDAPYPVGSGWLGDAELDEARALLLALISHWPALGKTSPDGLRVSFLQRAGLLYPAPDGWQLRLQPESFDVLLDRLPWGLSLIRLPWLPRTLHVDWSRS